ncbi:uncharacterized protein LOC112046549 [Bicyclus anynana]|uniref:Uncharacterized protein LOC112046549 n=1 Tax=Bicyclus anynana TaxID=110368 RepID=A0A6J1N1S8_BICAN|nr:uncharacterized protein LOC112046549 [Bicyclus anynana]
MLTLPKTQCDPKKTAGVCKCRPICKSRRREWKGELQKTSGELLIERKPAHECFRRWPMKVQPNGPCPLLGRSRHVTVVPRAHVRPQTVVRICQGPVEDTVDTPYLKLAQIIKNLGAMDAVKSCCPFCACTGCCVCRVQDYEPADETRDKMRQRDMRVFDERVSRDFQTMRIMY